MNPFSSCFVQPGAIRYGFVDGGSLENLVDRFAVLKCRAAIVGPHGSGKSTLLHTLAPRMGAIELRSEGVLGVPSASPTAAFNGCQEPDAAIAYRIRWFRLNAQNRSPEPLLADSAHWHQGTLLVLDGFEQLTWWRRALLVKRVRERKAGLLATTHQPSWFLPTLWRTTVSPSSIRYVLEQLVPDDHARQRMMASPQWQSSRNRWPTNLRETFFDMYDWIEDQRASGSTKPAC
jgi:hypothetical protein